MTKRLPVAPVVLDSPYLAGHSFTVGEMLGKRMAAGVALCLIVSGCMTADPGVYKQKVRYYTQNVPDLDPNDVAGFRERNNRIMVDFAALAGVTDPGPNGEWRPVVDAGINYVDTRCDRFMDALFWLNRARETASRQTQYTGAAVGAALAVVEASKNAIGLTPLGFSLFDQTVNNISAGLLYNLNPSTVRILVEKRQEAYLASLTPSYTSKAVALRVIQGYASVCLPPAIEAEVERAIAAKEYEPNTLLPAAPPAADDRDPNPFTFADVLNVAKGSQVPSNPIVVTGIGSPAAISVQNGDYRILGHDWTSDAGVVQTGQHVQVRVVAPDDDDSAKTATLTIGAVSGTFTVRTKPAGPAIQAIEVPPVTGPAEPVVTTTDQNGIPNPQ